MPEPPQSGRAIVVRKSAVGFSSVNTTVFGSGEVTPATLAMPRRRSRGRQRHCVAGARKRFPGPDHVVRSERRAVVEGHAVAQLEGVGLAVLGDNRSSKRAGGPGVVSSRMPTQAFDQVQLDDVGVEVAVHPGLGWSGCRR
jgi:hypothetical protein